MRRPLVLALVVVSACGQDRIGTSDPVTPPVDPAMNAFTPPPPPRTPTPPHGPPYPVVFVHGMAGFDALKVGGFSMDYFGNTVQDLQARGEDVYRVVLPPFDTVEVRAKELRRQVGDILFRTNAAKVNLIAHSQGGLDSRYLVSPGGLGWGDKVATLVTISTPHRGTKVANAAAAVDNTLPDQTTHDVLEGVAGLLSRTIYDVQADPHLRQQVAELSEGFLLGTFNPQTPDDPRVRYLSWAGRSNLHTGLGVCDGATFTNEPWKVDALLPLFSGVVIGTEWGLPANVSDGLVTVESAKWGTFQGCVPADHLDEVGMPNANGVDLSIFDSKQFYRDVVAELRAHGH